MNPRDSHRCLHVSSQLRALGPTATKATQDYKARVITFRGTIVSFQTQRQKGVPQ
jgi:hypothetical protein